MTDIQIFNNELFGEIRTLEDENGKILFCGSDVARALGYVIPSKAVSTHCKGVSKMEVPTNGGNQLMLFIPEGDVYRLIAHSKLPAAEQFERWIFDEVLPTIRKTGGYVANENNFIETYLPFADENTKTLFRLTLDTVRQQNEIIAKQSKQIEDERPLVEFADHVSNSTNLIDVGELSKLARKENIDIGRTRLFKWLRSNEYLMSSSIHKNEPYQRYIEQGLFVVREYTYETPYGTQTGLKTYVTGKGQIYFIEKLRKLFGKHTTMACEAN